MSKDNTQATDFNQANNTLIKKETVPFVMTHHSVCVSTELSFKAKGLLTYLLDKPPNWKFSLNGIAAQAKDGIDSIRSGLRELVLEGYLEVKRLVNDRNQYSGSQWIITQYPEKSSENSKKVSRIGFSNAGNPSAGNPNTKKEYIKKDSSKYKKEKLQKEKKKEVFNNVWLTEQEHTVLKSRYGEALVQECIEDYSCWKSSNCIERTSDYLTLNKWVKKEHQKREMQKVSYHQPKFEKTKAQKVFQKAIFSTCPQKGSLKKVDFSSLKESLEKPYEELNIPSDWKLSKGMVIYNYLSVFGKKIVAKAVELMKIEGIAGEYQIRLTEKCNQLKLQNA